MSINEKIVAIAQGYIGQTEKPGNAGFNNAAFEAKIKQTGWAKGQSWCAYFCELVWKEAYTGTGLTTALDKLFSASATATFANFKASANFKVVAKPVPGAVAIWRYGNGWQGHAGIVSRVEADTFYCIEGNTNDAGGREGYMVAQRKRKLNEPFKAKGLNLLGFVVPV